MLIVGVGYGDCSYQVHHDGAALILRIQLMLSDGLLTLLYQLVKLSCKYQPDGQTGTGWIWLRLVWGMIQCIGFTS